MSVENWSNELCEPVHSQENHGQIEAEVKSMLYDADYCSVWKLYKQCSNVEEREGDVDHAQVCKDDTCLGRLQLSVVAPKTKQFK